MDKKKLNALLKDYLAVSLGIISYTVGWSIFLMPNNLVGGGVSGIAAIVYYALKIPMGYTYFVVNAILLAIAMKILGSGFGGKTIYAIVLASVMLNIWPHILPDAFIRDFALANGKLICNIAGGVMSGVGIGLAISHGGSTGGTDIIALLINKYRNISPGKILLWVDVLVILSALIVPSYDADGNKLVFAERIATTVYGFVLIAVNSYVLDLYLAGSKQSVQVMIFSQKYQELADAVAFDLKRGVSILPAYGWYSKSENKVLMVVARKSALNNLLKKVKEIDPEAFISVTSAMGVYGKGFDTIKVRTTQKVE